MNTITLLGFLVLIIFLEAVTDALTYKGWTIPSKVAGAWAHVTQILMLLAGVLTGYWLKTVVEFTSVNMGALLLVAGSVHLFIFDSFYKTLSGQTKEGTVPFWDRLVTRLKLNKYPLVWSIVKGLLLFGSIILISTILDK